MKKAPRHCNACNRARYLVIFAFAIDIARRFCVDGSVLSYFSACSICFVRVWACVCGVHGLQCWRVGMSNVTALICMPVSDPAPTSLWEGSLFTWFPWTAVSALYDVELKWHSCNMGKIIIFLKFQLISVELWYEDVNDFLFLIGVDLLIFNWFSDSLVELWLGIGNEWKSE